MSSSISSLPYTVQKFQSGEIEMKDDCLAIEEPLEIRISFLDEHKKRTVRTLSVTMRTPGIREDIELGGGFLFTEGIIQFKHNLQKILQIDEHVILAELSDSVTPVINKLERNFYTSSSCGVCGKTSIDAVKTVCPVQTSSDNFIPVSAAIIYSLPGLLTEKQNTFAATGGLHASALFDESGNMILLREDVGRHNALDKLIGASMLDDLLPLKNHILLLSGRASFELIQKATMAGITFVCAVGAPSSLAVQLAAERKMTLIGFLRNERFNIYCGAHRIESV